MNRRNCVLTLLVFAMSVYCGHATSQEGSRNQAPRTVTGTIDSIDLEASIIVVGERALEFDDKLVVRDRTGKVLAGGLAALNPGLQVRCLETLEDRRPYTKEIWVLGSSEQRPGGPSK